jgi:SAM-dependent methyltransferase
VGTRFTAPIGALLHDRQVDAVAGAIGQATGTRRVLEIAPGPARVTADVAARVGGAWTLVDASAQMLDVARSRLPRPAAWKLIQGDAFALPVAGPFDVVYSFRFVRHFEAPERQRIYREMARVLRPGGTLVFDAVNEVVSAPIRAAAPHEYAHYDALLRPETLREELARAGFRDVTLRGVQHRFGVLRQIQILLAPRSAPIARALMNVVERFGGGEPLEWIVTCRRV